MQNHNPVLRVVDKCRGHHEYYHYGDDVTQETQPLIFMIKTAQPRRRYFIHSHIASPIASPTVISTLKKRVTIWAMSIAAAVKK